MLKALLICSGQCTARIIPLRYSMIRLKLIRANQEGDYYSIVARSTDGEIIGIHNLFRSAPSRAVYEWGVGLVLKEWRSIGVSGAIERFMIDTVVPELGMHTVFGEPVTIHLQMQKHSENYGFQPTALEVGLMPGEAYSGEGVISNRVSTLSSFRVYRNIPQKIFLPVTYNEAIRFMYGDFSSGRTFLNPLNPFPSAPFPKLRWISSILQRWLAYLFMKPAQILLNAYRTWNPKQ